MTIVPDSPAQYNSPVLDSMPAQHSDFATVHIHEKSSPATMSSFFGLRKKKILPYDPNEVKTANLDSL